jgi:hypothetical protein
VEDRLAPFRGGDSRRKAPRVRRIALPFAGGCVRRPFFSSRCTLRGCDDLRRVIVTFGCRSLGESVNRRESACVVGLSSLRRYGPRREVLEAIGLGRSSCSRAIAMGGAGSSESSNRPLARESSVGRASKHSHSQSASTLSADRRSRAGHDRDARKKAATVGDHGCGGRGSDDPVGCARGS